MTTPAIPESGPDEVAAPVDPLQRWGTIGWRFVGIALAVTIAYSALVGLSGLVVPLLLATVIGMLAVPLVDRLEARRLPRRIAALLVVVGLVTALIGTVALIIIGLFQQQSEIRAVLTAGTESISSWFDDLRIDIGDPNAIVDSAGEQGIALLTGAATWLTTVFSGAMAFAIGTFLALFMLYYILADWTSVRQWVASHLAVPTELGHVIVDDATSVVRRGFVAITINSLITAMLIGLTMLALGLPLVIAVTLVTFLTSYIPYLGAILSGIFGFVVALGAGGPEEAVILLVVILVVQNIVQTIVGNQLTSNRLHLHPLPSIISSVCGVAIAGLLGAMLSAPAVALGIAISRRVKDARRTLGADATAAPGTQGDPA